MVWTESLMHEYYSIYRPTHAQKHSSVMVKVADCQVNGLGSIHGHVSDLLQIMFC